jgi:hypothetical protein
MQWLDDIQNRLADTPNPTLKTEGLRLLLAVFSIVATTILVSVAIGAFFIVVGYVADLLNLSWDGIAKAALIAIAVPLAAISALFASPYGWFIAIAFLAWLIIIAPINRAWRAHCLRQQRIIEILEKIERRGRG